MKRALNSVKQVLNSIKTQSNGRVNPLKPQILYITSPGTLKLVCSYTPRFSYRCPKYTVSACPRVLCRARTDRGVQGGAGRVGVPRWVYRVGNTGYYRAPTNPALKSTRRPATAGSGPSPQGRVGRKQGAGPGGDGGWDGPGTTPAGPVGSQDPPCTGTSQIAASWPIRARFHLIFYKVSQKAGVSPKYVEKACHSPCLQNGSQKSPLDFLGFPYSAAFSHKELSGHFDPYL